MTLKRASNFALFLIACAALAAVHLLWMKGAFPSRPMFIYSGVCLIVMVATIICEARMSAEPKRRGFDLVGVEEIEICLSRRAPAVDADALHEPLELLPALDEPRERVADTDLAVMR